MGLRRRREASDGQLSKVLWAVLELSPVDLMRAFSGLRWVFRDLRAVCRDLPWISGGSSAQVSLWFISRWIPLGLQPVSSGSLSYLRGSSRSLPPSLWPPLLPSVNTFTIFWETGWNKNFVILNINYLQPSSWYQINDINFLIIGTDSRVGFGFRLGDHADFQVMYEIGPQIYTKKIGDQSSNDRRRFADPDKKKVILTLSVLNKTKHWRYFLLLTAYW